VDQLGVQIPCPEKRFTMTQSYENFSILRKILRAIGLPDEAVEDIVERIVDFLSEPSEKEARLEYPYSVRDDFLSPAEQSFYLVLKSTVSDWALVCPKVALGDLFCVKSDDSSKFRTYRNKIDRKHVDFLLCNLKTARPLLGIELDDKSHQRRERQDRDDFVQNVFAAAQLPLVRIPVQHSYSVTVLNELLRQHLGSKEVSPSNASLPVHSTSTSPVCPKCGGTMVLRTAKNGANQGGQFWGCSNYPRCRGIVKYEPATNA
jgi:predicted RNA-binding Zn-ribbon protein involved in translation (DUF1610 family)